jgi:hypothetical protein
VNGIIIESFIVHWDIENSMILNKIVQSNDNIGIDLVFIGFIKLINIPGKFSKMAVHRIERVLPNP